MCKKGLNCKSSVRQIIHFIKAFVFLYSLLFCWYLCVSNYFYGITGIDNRYDCIFRCCCCCIEQWWYYFISFYIYIDDMAIFTGALTGVHFSVMLQTRIYFILFITYFNFVVFFLCMYCWTFYSSCFSFFILLYLYIWLLVVHICRYFTYNSTLGENATASNIATVFILRPTGCSIQVSSVVLLVEYHEKVEATVIRLLIHKNKRSHRVRVHRSLQHAFASIECKIKRIQYVYNINLLFYIHRIQLMTIWMQNWKQIKLFQI